MSRSVIPPRFPALLIMALSCLWGVVPLDADEAIGVLDSFDPSGSEGAGVWRIDGENYVVRSDSENPIPGVSSVDGAVVPVLGHLVRVGYDLQDGIRYVTSMQRLGHGPEAVQDGPHLIWKNATSATMITVVDGEVIRTEHTGLSDGDELPTPSRAVPMIRVESDPVCPPASLPVARRILAVSDLEGNYDTFLTFLTGNGVIDGAGNWAWGDGHLVLNGDIVDRGDRVTELLWLIRRLERQAGDAGGHVHFVLGNHESMVLAGDLRYIHPNYRFSTDRIGLSYDRLHGPDSELGRWLRNHNSVVRVGPLLFVHAGYSPQLDRLGLDLDEINETIRVGLGPPAWPSEARADLRTGLIWHQQGPHWYRGYFPEHAERWGGRPGDDALEAILTRHGAKHIVVGHTVVDQVGHIDGRVQLIGIDVAWRDPSEAEGLLHDEGRLYRVDASGQRTELAFEAVPTPSE